MLIRMSKALLLLLPLAAIANSLITSNLYDESDTEQELLRTAGQTRFVFFQPTTDLELVEVVNFGTPVNYVAGVSQYRWDLFQTNENWETPNGNNDRVWFSPQVSFADLGKADYVQAVGVTLDTGAFYRLSFQILNVDWLQTVYTRDIAKPSTFSTTDGLFTVHGASGVSVPGGNDFPAISLNVREVAEPVTIDIKPGSDPNSINPTSKGKIPVAILTVGAFDATQVDVSTVAFGPAGASESHGRSHVEDVDNDGDMDLVLHFNTQDTGIQCGDTGATLTGDTWAGGPITGSDAITTVNCP